MNTLDQSQRRALHVSALWMTLTYVLTTIHHVYSSTLYAPEAGIAGVFAGSWRAHGFLVFLVPLLIGAGALAAYSRTLQRGWLHLYGAVNGLLFIGLVSLWEGGWNHLAKLVFFALGAEESYTYGPPWLLQFPTVVPPTDLFFEATGVLTLLIGALNARYLWRLRDLPRRAVRAAAF